LSETGLPDCQLPRKESTLFNRDRFRGHASLQNAGLVNCYGASSYNLRRHSAFNVDRVDGNTPETLHVGSSLERDVLCPKTTWNFANEVNRDRFFALKITAQLAFDYGRLANNAGAAEIAFIRQENVAARANRTAETGGNLIIAQIDMGAAAGTIGRGGCIAHLVLPLAFETGNKPRPTAFPHSFKSSQRR